MPTWLILLLCGGVACAQTPREYPLTVRDRMTVANEALMPAPAGWGIPLIGIRNAPRQHLATLVFYSDALHAFSEISLPQSVILDAAPVSDSAGAPLLMLAARSESLWMFPVNAHRGIETGVALEPGAQGLTATAGSATIVGVAVTPGGADTLLVLLYRFYDQPLRHVLAAYTMRGTAAWQLLIGGAAVRASLVPNLGGAREPAILFSTDAAPHETTDTARISAKKAHIGVLATTGVLQWVQPCGAEATATWCVPMADRGAVLCAVRHADSAEVLMLDARDGRQRHFVRIAGTVALRTLCMKNNIASLGVVPDRIARFDSALRPFAPGTPLPMIDSAATMLPLRMDAAGYLLFTARQTTALDQDFSVLGYLDTGMVCEPAGPMRFSGARYTDDAIIAAVPGGATIRGLERNTWWWWYRYRAAAGLLAILTMMTIVITLVTRRFRFYRTYYNQLVRGSVTSGVVAINRQMRVIHLNNAARELLHIAPYIPMQRHITEYMGGAEYADILNGVRDCLQTRIAHEKIVTLQTGAQPRTLLSRARPTLTRNGVLAGCLLQLEDISRTIERERLMSWASVAHHVAHEMKTPIGTVLLNAQHVLKSEEELPDRARKYFHRIVTQAERLSGILQNFLSIARVSTMRFAPTDIVRAVQSIAADYGELIPSNITLTVRVGPLDDPMFNIDEQQLTTALRNILDNAVHAITPNAGTLTITLEEYAMPPVGAVAIAIRDSGKGMTEECRARMFEPFFTETPGGSGIGMVIVKRIIDEHKGFIDVESTLGEGTAVKIVLPRIL